MLVRFIAAGLMVLGVLGAGLYGGKDLAQHQPVRIFHLALPAIPFVLGVVILTRTSAIAGWISDRLDE